MAFNYALGRQAMIKGITSYDDDVWIVSYPKSGNTWTRFLIGNLVADLALARLDPRVRNQ